MNTYDVERLDLIIYNRKGRGIRMMMPLLSFFIKEKDNELREALEPLY